MSDLPQLENQDLKNIEEITLKLERFYEDNLLECHPGNVALAMLFFSIQHLGNFSVQREKAIKELLLMGAEYWKEIKNHPEYLKIREYIVQNSKGEIEC